MNRAAFLFALLVTGMPAARAAEPSAPADACTRLHPGESSVVRWTAEESPTHARAGYRLTRLDTQRWLAELRLRFTPAPDYDGTVPAKDAPADFAKRAGACLREAAEVLRAQDQRLELRLVDSPEVPLHEITLGRRGSRSHSARYRADITCPEILHEVLHLLGLVDEYTGDANGYRFENGAFVFNGEGNAQFPFSCRVPGLPTSVMYSHEEAKLDTTEMEEWEVAQCECAADVDCEKKAKESDGASCPPGTVAAKGTQSLFPGAPVTAIVNPRFFVLPQGEHKLKQRQRFQDSMLSLTHFRVITAPGCAENACYYAFARNAYRFEVPESAGIKAPHAARGCLPVPPECGKKGDWRIH